MSLGFISLFAAGIIFGWTDVALKKIQNNDNTLAILIGKSLVSVLGLIILYITSQYFNDQFINWQLVVSQPDMTYISMAILLSAVSFLGLYFFMQALKYKSVSETVGLNKIELIIAVIISIFLYQEDVSLTKIICILLVMIGVIILDNKTQEKKSGLMTRGLLYIILARIFWSAGLFFIPSIKALGVILFSLIMEAVVLLLSISFLFIEKQQFQFNTILSKSIFKPVVIIGTLGIAAVILSNISKDQLPVMLIALLSLTSPITVLLFSRWNLNEKLTTSQWLGIGLGTLGSLIYLF